MSGRDSHCVLVLILDKNVFYDVLLFDVADEDAPYVDVSNLSALRNSGRSWSFLG